MKKNLVMIVAASLAALGMTGMAMADEKITVAASPTPHAEILEQAKSILAEEGYELEVIEFEDYTVEELCEIFGYDMKKRGYALNYDAEVLKARMVSESEKKDFGNARGVRNLCDKVIATHNNRINHMDIGSLDNETLITITDADLS